MSLVAGLDLGTSGVKLVVLDADGTLVAEASEPYPTRTLTGGEVEQDPEHWWRAACAVLQRCGRGREIVAIGLTGQMQDLVPVRRRRALRAALLYSDTRAGLQQRRVAGLIPDWEVRTGNLQDLTSLPAKIAWLAANEPDVLGAAEHLLLGPSGYVAHRAGARAVCDVTTASSTGLLDVAGRGWMPEAVAAAGAERGQLPRLTGSTAGDALVGQVHPDVAAELGVPAGTPLVMTMGDAGSTTAGLVGTEPGEAYLYLGTTGWVAGITPAAASAPSPVHSLVMPGWDQRLRIGSVQSAGSAAAWALATLLPGATFADAERRAFPRLGRLAERPLCLPGLAGERTPLRDGDLRGAFVGVQETTTPEDLYLAVLTGVAMGLKHAADEMGLAQDRIPLVGGAAHSGVWRQVLADVFGATIVTGTANDPAAGHAAQAAADAVWPRHGLRPIFGDASHQETAPSGVHAEYGPLIEAHRGLYDALVPTFHRLADLRSAASSR